MRAKEGDAHAAFSKFQNSFVARALLATRTDAFLTRPRPCIPPFQGRSLAGTSLYHFSENVLFSETLKRGDTRSRPGLLKEPAVRAKEGDAHAALSIFQKSIRPHGGLQHVSSRF